MKTYRRTQILFILLIVVYTAVSYTTKRVQGREFFPFFNWSLFTHVPNEKHDYGLRILAIEGEPLETPLYFEEADALFGEAHSIVAYKAIQEYGKAVRVEDEATVAETRPFIESIYLESQPVQYELVRRTFLPIIRFQTGEFIKEEMLAQFEVEGQAP